MLSLTRKADYAVMAMAELARRYPERVSARNLAVALRVPLPVLTGVLHQLRQAELVCSMMGGKGGYTLARGADELDLAEIVEAIEGPIRLALCCGDEPAGGHADASTCDLEPDCGIKESVKRVHTSLRLFLQRIRLKDLASKRQPSTLIAARGSDGETGSSGCGCGGARRSATTVTVEVSSLGSE